MEPNPYESPRTRNLASKRSVSQLWEVALFAMVGFGTAPVGWFVIWWFYIYSQPSTSDVSSPTDFEKWDTFWGLLPLTLMVSVFVGPLVVLWKVVSQGSWKALPVDDSGDTE